MAWNVVIAGGGFAGLYAARALERALPRHSAKVTLISESTFLLYFAAASGGCRRSAQPAACDRAAA
jgi:NADH dehydrogenase